MAGQEYEKPNLEDAACEIARLEGELDAYLFAVSHDLRFPLRVIEGYVRALEEDYPEQLDAPARRYLRSIRGGVSRLESMIERLRELSEIARTPMVLATVDVTDAARRIADELGARHGRRLAPVIAEGVTVKGDRRLLETALEQLLDNAWKFTGPRDHPEIELGRRADGTLFVRDNGVGFDPSAPRLFAPFRRLHRPEEFPGDGIGLAIVQRVITRHRGRVWAEGAVDEGATLCFTVP